MAADDVNSLRALVASLLTDPSNPEAIEKAGRLLTTIAEIERQKAEAGKLSAEEVKIRSELSDVEKRRRSDERKFYGSLVVPIFSAIVLGGTLLLQTHQTYNAERDKQLEQQAQRESAEDVRWSDALKSMSDSDKDVSVTDIYLKQFYNSQRYGDLAKDTAFQRLLKTDDAVRFHDRFTGAFEPVSWVNLDKVLDLDRSLAGRFRPLDWKGIRNLGELEKVQYDALYQNISFLCGEVGTLLKSPRPMGAVLDLRSTDFWDCDLSNADLSEANLDGFSAFRLVLKGADLTGAKNFHGANLQQNAWWQASRMSRELFEYLKQTAPFDAKTDYGEAKVSKEEYEAAIARLDKSL